MREKTRLAMIDYSLPKRPGVYLFKDSAGEVIYVGKAKDLRARVASYFRGQDRSVKTRHLVAKIASIDHIEVDSEIEALLLENRLIKQHSPRYNINLKDGKTFAYIKFTQETYPRMLTTRRVTRDGAYFGPYVSGQTRLELMRLCVRLFKIRTCKDPRPCLKSHIGLCTYHHQTPQEYAEQVAKAAKFLKGDVSVRAELEQQMKSASSQMLYEQASQRKKELEALDSLLERQKIELVRAHDQDVIATSTGEKLEVFMFTISKGVISNKKSYTFDDSHTPEEFIKMYYSGQKIPREIIADFDVGEPVRQYLERLRQGPVTITRPQRGEKLALLELAAKNLKQDPALSELSAKLRANIRVIECFDASNLGEEHIVAGMVRFVDGKPDRSGYRKFKIRSPKRDDYASLAQAVERRYLRLKEEGSQMPDLVLIDGGKGQLRAALAALESISVKLNVAALAKQNEELYLPGLAQPLGLPKNSPAMLLLRRVRDEVHRYALGYNRKKREMAARQAKQAFLKRAKPL